MHFHDIQARICGLDILGVTLAGRLPGEGHLLDPRAHQRQVLRVEEDLRRFLARSVCDALWSGRNGFSALRSVRF